MEAVLEDVQTRGYSVGSAGGLVNAGRFVERWGCDGGSVYVSSDVYLELETGAVGGLVWNSAGSPRGAKSNSSHMMCHPVTC